MKKLAEFVSEHIASDISRLIMNKAKWPEIDMSLAVACIESRRKLKGKIQEWYDNPDLIFPLKISAEQCSSSATAAYKAGLAERIVCEDESRKWKLADLTGGLGVDSWFFSKLASKVLYNEMRKPLCDAAAHNFKALTADNIRISNNMIVPEGIEIADPALTGSGTEGSAATPAELLSEFRPDIVYMDPARRGEGGKKVFLIEECTPDVLTLKNEIFRICRHMLIKLSPMADISMACNRLGKTCREVHVVASGGECKELQIWMDREWNDEYTTVAVELNNDGKSSEFRFKPSEEASARPLKAGSEDAYQPGMILFEPGKSLMKSGAFNLISEKFSIVKLGTSTHYYIAGAELSDTIHKHGTTFTIKEVHPLDKRSIKNMGKAYPKAEVTARNIPMDTDTLRKKLGVTSGDDAHIFGLNSDSLGNLLIITERC